MKPKVLSESCRSPMLGTNLYSHLPPGNQRVSNDWILIRLTEPWLSLCPPHQPFSSSRTSIRERSNNKYQQNINVDKCGWKRDEKSSCLEFHFVFATKWQVSTLVGTTHHYSACLMSPSPSLDPHPNDLTRVQQQLSFLLVLESGWTHGPGLRLWLLNIRRHLWCFWSVEICCVLRAFGQGQHSVRNVPVATVSLVYCNDFLSIFFHFLHLPTIYCG